MEDALAPQEFTPALSNGKVLILVVMEDALVQVGHYVEHLLHLLCPNPCCNGRCTRTFTTLPLRI